jgi:hypothetical protein
MPKDRKLCFHFIISEFVSPRRVKICVVVRFIFTLNELLHGLIYSAVSHSSSGKMDPFPTRQATGDGIKSQVLLGDTCTAASSGFFFLDNWLELVGRFAEVELE